MFGAICSGRPIQLANQVEPTKYVISIPNAANVSHIAVFLLPQTEFVDPSLTALVYFQLPNSSEFKLLGGLNPLKASAIYKLNNSNQNKTTSAQLDDIDMNVEPNENLDATINIGISIEPTSQAEALLLEERQKQEANSSSLIPSTSSTMPATQGNLTLNPSNPQDIAALAHQIVMHAYNFLGSFVDASGNVPMKAFDSWWEKFKNKLANNPGFLDLLKS